MISVHDITNKSLPCDSNYIVDVIMRTKFGDFTTSMKEISQPQFYKGLTRKTNLFEVISWFKFNNLELILGMALKFHTNVAKWLQLKVRKSLEKLIPAIVEVTGKRLVGGLFGVLMNRIKKKLQKRCFLVRFQKFLRTLILKNIKEELLLC